MTRFDELRDIRNAAVLDLKRLADTAATEARALTAAELRYDAGLRNLVRGIDAELHEFILSTLGFLNNLARALDTPLPSAAAAADLPQTMPAAPALRAGANVH